MPSVDTVPGQRGGAGGSISKERNQRGLKPRRENSQETDSAGPSYANITLQTPETALVPTTLPKEGLLETRLRSPGLLYFSPQHLPGGMIHYVLSYLCILCLSPPEST